MAKIERIYTIPLRREWLKAPAYKRSKKAMTAIREFLIKHMKSENVKLGRMLNMHVWEQGIKRPPHHVKITAVKYDDGLVRAELIGHPIEEKKEEKADKKAKKKEEKPAKPKKAAKSKKEEPISPSQ
ncbi:50S ribosomal protein L31e [Candidatus Woesearchaeota archaeon]|nr:50S ribosomal protein L31e [Candidatus Woesearchaeota archaeon]